MDHHVLAYQYQLLVKLVKYTLGSLINCSYFLSVKIFKKYKIHMFDFHQLNEYISTKTHQLRAFMKTKYRY